MTLDELKARAKKVAILNGKRTINNAFPDIDRDALYLGVYPQEVFNEVKSYAITIFTAVQVKKAEIDSKQTQEELDLIDLEITI